MSTAIMAIAELDEEKSLLSEESCWEAVLRRDSGLDGAFVYGVRSTGVFCRPSCPSRRPRREQVRFFPIPEAAEQAGFRSCLRCKPSDAEVHDPHLGLVQRVCRLIEQEPEDEGAVSLGELSEAVGLSPYHLQRVFKRVMGISPRQYAEALRVRRLKESLRGGETVTNALYDSGYNSSSGLYGKAVDHLGMTPATYRKGGVSTQIYFTIAQSPLGRLLVAATERGICAIRMGDSDTQLEATLHAEYHSASIQRDDSVLGEWVEAILAHLAGRQPHLDLPLDVRATAFQFRVWEALRAIPYGDTRSYLDVATAIGQPTAVRAVARACATNPVALVVPCHRVIKEDGSLGGYRWGMERKQALLDTEHHVATQDYAEAAG
ncbi:MAG: AraC family transcriptional regulator [Chloroflexia bacterium]|jgi:AraC family transcriptional regulator of adaptative response/methylated-DNA-[protein]-cysteine methyltransferase|nr:AraC family transcriptional regulator [Chloroflexia bacterium]